MAKERGRFWKKLRDEVPDNWTRYNPLPSAEALDEVFRSKVLEGSVIWIPTSDTRVDRIRINNVFQEDFSWFVADDETAWAKVAVLMGTASGFADWTLVLRREAGDTTTLTFSAADVYGENFDGFAVLGLKVANEVRRARQLVQAGTADVAFSNQHTASVSVSFPGNFNTAPFVVASNREANATGRSMVATCEAVTTGGFTLTGRHADGTLVTGTVTFNWVAVGGDA